MRYAVIFNFRLDPDERAAAIAKARSQDMSLAQVLRRLLREWLVEDAPEATQKVAQAP